MEITIKGTETELSAFYETLINSNGKDIRNLAHLASLFDSDFVTVPPDILQSGLDSTPVLRQKVD